MWLGDDFVYFKNYIKRVNSPVPTLYMIFLIFLKKVHIQNLCQCQILHIHWSQHVKNAEVSARTSLPPVMDFIRRRRLFGHVARPAYTGDSSTQRPTLPSRSSIWSFTWWGLEWRRRPGRTRARWTDQLRNDTGSVPANLWRRAILWGYGGASSDATARAGYSMTTTIS